MNLIVRAYEAKDVAVMAQLWNAVVEEGVAFPQQEPLADPAAFFAGQTCCGVAEDADTGEVVGMYILHPNNVGRVGHIGNCSYAVRGDLRNGGVGRALVSDSLEQAKKAGFRLIQFNAVVKTNANARHLYESLGFQTIGTVPGGFRMKDGRYEDIVLYYCRL